MASYGEVRAVPKSNTFDLLVDLSLIQNLWLRIKNLVPTGLALVPNVMMIQNCPVNVHNKSSRLKTQDKTFIFHAKTQLQTHSL